MESENSSKCNTEKFQKILKKIYADCKKCNTRNLHFGTMITKKKRSNQPKICYGKKIRINYYNNGKIKRSV